MTTPDELSAVIQAAANEEIGRVGGLVTGILGLATFIDADGDRQWCLFTGEEQHMAISLGMAKIIRMTVEGQAAEIIFSDD
jgi:hypothetical protein